MYILRLLKHISLHNKLKHYVVQVHVGKLKCMISEAESNLVAHTYYIYSIPPVLTHSVGRSSTDLSQCSTFHRQRNSRDARTHA